MTARRLSAFIVVLLFVGLLVPLGAGAVGTFTDDDGNFHEANIEAIAAAGITQGCAPQLFCPAEGVSRAQMVTFLIRAIGQVGNIGPYQGRFPDVPAGEWFTGPVELAVQLGITTGYEDGTFQPFQLVTRAEVAVFLGRALGLMPQAGSNFADVRANAWYAGHVEAIRQAGITTGCTPTQYCPDASTRRDEMASFLARAVLPATTTTTSSTSTTIGGGGGGPGVPAELISGRRGGGGDSMVGNLWELEFSESMREPDDGDFALLEDEDGTVVALECGETAFCSRLGSTIGLVVVEEPTEVTAGDTPGFADSPGLVDITLSGFSGTDGLSVSSAELLIDLFPPPAFLILIFVPDFGPDPASMVGNEWGFYFSRPMMDPDDGDFVLLEDDDGTQLRLVCGDNSTCTQVDTDAIEVVVDSEPTVVEAGAVAGFQGDWFLTLDGFTDGDGNPVT